MDGLTHAANRVLKKKLFSSETLTVLVGK